MLQLGPKPTTDILSTGRQIAISEIRVRVLIAKKVQRQNMGRPSNYLGQPLKLQKQLPQTIQSYVPSH